MKKKIYLYNLGKSTYIRPIYKEKSGLIRVCNYFYVIKKYYSFF